MRLLVAVVALYAGVAGSLTLEDAVEQFEPCALLCYHAAAEDNECNPGDFRCLCSNPGSLVVKMKICAGKACDGVKLEKNGTYGTDLDFLMVQLCEEFDSKPSSSEVAAASSLLLKEYSSVEATATSNPAPKSTAAAKSTNHAPAPAITDAAAALGVMGIAAAVALVL